MRTGRPIADGLAADPLLSAQLACYPGRRVPGCWNGFELGVRAILEQQCVVAGASGLVKRFGQPFSAPGGLTHLFPAPPALGPRACRTMRRTRFALFQGP
jgi:AraC family transcriptional regulator of adaptative response / DNA-3-methyladenine glycosylase II